MKICAYLFAVFSVLLLIAALAGAAPLEESENMMDMQSEASLDGITVNCLKPPQGSSRSGRSRSITVNCDE
jgi:hypothetical protein